MSYISDIVSPLVRVLDHTRGLPRHLLAAHAVNIEFWVDEVCHVLQVIDGYNHRFYRMREAQARYDQDHGGHPVNNPSGTFDSLTSEPPVRPSVSDAELKSLRAQVLVAIGELIDRLAREAIVSLEDRSALELRMKSKG